MSDNELTDSRAIIDTIKIIAGTYGLVPVKICECEVISVNEEDRICVVSAVDGKEDLDNFTVKYMLDISDGDTEVPEIDSVVLVMFSSFTQPSIIKSTWLSKKEIVVGDQSYSIIDGVQTFNDGKYGGIPIVEDPDNPTTNGLTKRYNLIEDKLNQLINIFTSWTPVPNDGGLALKTALSTWITTSLNLTTKQNIENPNILHGDKNEIE